MHWINAVAMLVMITSGWGIYDDDVIIRGLHFGQAWRLGEWAAWSLNWHFAGMWFLALNGMAYLTYGFLTGRFRERLLPIRLSEFLHTIAETLRLKIAHEDLTVYNAVQKSLLYTSHRGRRLAGGHWAGDLETGAILRPGFVARRLPGRARRYISPA